MSQVGRVSKDEYLRLCRRGSRLRAILLRALLLATPLLLHRQRSHILPAVAVVGLRSILGLPLCLESDITTFVVPKKQKKKR